MSIDNFGHLDALEEYLSTDDDHGHSAYQPQSRRERRELERLSAANQPKEAIVDEEPEDDFASAPNVEGGVDPDEETKDKTPVADLAELELMKLLGADHSDDDEPPVASDRKDVHADDQPDLFESSGATVVTSGDTYSSDSDETEHVHHEDDERDFAAAPADETPDHTDDDNGGIDYGAWIDSDDDDDDLAPLTSALPEYRPVEDAEPERPHFTEHDAFEEPYVPVQTTAMPVAAYEPDLEDELPKFNHEEHDFAPVRAADENKELDEPDFDHSSEDQRVLHADDDEDDSEESDDDAEYDEDDTPTGEDGNIDLVPEKRELKAGWFAGRQEKEDAREERDSVKRLNDLRNKIGTALATEQRLESRISDLTEEAEARETLQDIMRKIESASERLQEVRNELERANA